MNNAMMKRLAKLESAQPVEKERQLIVPLPEYVPAGFKGRIVITGVPRPGDKLEAA